MTSWAELRGVLLALAGFVVLLLLIVSFSPGLPGEMLLQSLRLHLIAAGLGLVFLLFVSGARWRSGIVLLLMLAASAHVAKFIVELHERRQPIAGAPVAELRVLSYNVLAGNPRGAEAAQHIAELAPDIAIIMETPGIEDDLDKLEAVLPYHLGCDDKRSCDLSIWSRYPIIEKEMFLPPPYRHERLGIVRVDVNGTIMTVVGAHLSKPYFDEASWFEVNYIARAFTKLSGPILLTGDFNAAPWSDTLIYLTREAQLVPPPSHPASWPVKAGPLGVPIDNMFTRGAAQIEDIEAGADSYGSNHRYLLARLALYASP